MTDHIIGTTDTELPKRFNTPRRRSLFAYCGAAILAGLASAVIGSSVCVTAAYAFRGDAVGLTEYLIILTWWALYSGMVILPLSLLLGFPLMVLFRNSGRVVKFLVSTVAGAVCGALISFSVSQGFNNLIETLAIGTAYGAAFGSIAAVLPKRSA